MELLRAHEQVKLHWLLIGCLLLITRSCVSHETAYAFITRCAFVPHVLREFIACHINICIADNKCIPLHGIDACCGA